MLDKEQTLEKKIEELQETNINLRFNTVEDKLTKITELLENLTKTTGNNHEILEKRVRDLEDKQKNCPVTTLGRELKRYSLETKWIRLIYDKPWKWVVVQFSITFIIIVILAAFGVEPVLKLLTMFR